MSQVSVEKCKCCGKYDDELSDGVCITCETEMEHTTDEEYQASQNWADFNYDHSSIMDDVCNIIEDIEDVYRNISNPCRCGQDDIYHPVLTNNLCLNCYQDQLEDRKRAEIEYEYDLAQGLI